MIPVAPMRGGLVGRGRIEGRHRRLGAVRALGAAGDPAFVAEGFEGRMHIGAEEIGALHLDPVSPCVGDEGGGRVEPHRLRPEEPGEEGGGIVQLDPGAGVDEEPERQRV